MNPPLANTLVKTYIIGITPQTHVRATQGDRIFFRIPREKLHKQSLARLERLERYNKYKVDLLTLCRVKGFVLPSQGLSIKFFMPMPKTWREWQRGLMDGKLHRDRPDVDNLLKAVFDSLMAEDKFIGHLAEVSKHWVDSDRGWIEFNVSEQIYPEMELPKTKKAAIKSGLLTSTRHIKTL